MRTTTLWNDNWNFMKNAADAAEAVQKCAAREAEQVMLPHTWNAVDGQDGGPDTPGRAESLLSSAARPCPPSSQ